MTAWIYVDNFGSDQQKRNLCASLMAVAGLAAFVGELEGHVVAECEVSQLGDVFTKLASDAATNWIEYTVQFDY
jgi:hypothetical protein